MKLLARFELSETQATRFYQQTERRKAGIDVKDDDILANPYLLYEIDRTQVDAVQLETIDRGMYPDPVVRVPGAHVGEDDDVAGLQAVDDLDAVDGCAADIAVRNSLSRNVLEVMAPPACALPPYRTIRLPMLIEARVSSGARRTYFHLWHGDGGGNILG